MSDNKRNPKIPSKKSGNSSKNVKKKSSGKLSGKDIALDKFEVDISSSKKKKSKTPMPKNPFKRLVISLIPQKTDAKNEKIKKIILLVAIAVLIGTLVFLITQIVGLNKGGKGVEDLASQAGTPFDTSIDYRTPDYIENPDPTIPTTAGDGEPEFIDLTPVVNTPLNVNFDKLCSQNPDTRAWIKISGTLVNNVVLAHDDPYNYYLDHDFYGNESISGEIFSSWRNKWDGTDDNIVLYGHNMRTGKFFAYIRHYVPNDYSREPLAFYKVHPTVMMQKVGGKSETYKIFAGCLFNTQEKYGDVYPYTTKTHFSSAEEFNDFILEIMDRSWFYTDVDLQYGDELLTLSTCHWPLGEDVDTRWVVFARKVRPGESEEVDTSVATRNYNQKLFDYYYRWMGSSGWQGRNWDTSKLLSY